MAWSRQRASFGKTAGPSMEEGVTDSRSRWKLGLGLAWIVFNLSLAIWWLIFGLRQIDFVQSTVGNFSPEHSATVAHFVRQQRMLISEGLILIISLLAGGGALLYYIVREKRRADQIHRFFATFSHELKTSIASLRLQVESLSMDFASSPSNPLFERLVKDSVRLEIQLENSLHLSQLESSRFFFERLDLKRFLSALEHQWPSMAIRVSGEADVFADHRALESVLKNLIQNAIVHGGATEVTFDVTEHGNSLVKIRVVDNGSGFNGKLDQLGKLFMRHNPKSGSGVGLFLVRNLVEKMGGRARFLGGPEGFLTELEFRAPPRSGA